MSPARRVVGLDLGASAIRAAEIVPATRRRPARVRRVGQIELPPGAIDHGVIRQPRVVVKALRSLWRRSRFSTRRVVWGIDPSSVLTRQMDLPWMEPDDFASALRFQVDDELPVDIRTVEVGYHLLQEMGTAPTGLPATNRVLVVATSREHLIATSRVLRKAGLRPVAADTHAFGLIRAASAEQPESTELLVDLGAEQMTMIIHRGGTPVLIRSVSQVAGETALRTLADTLDVDRDTALAEALRVGINGPAPILAPIPESTVFSSSAVFSSGGASSNGTVTTAPNVDDRTEQITAILGRWATTVVKEITDSLAYYASTSPSDRIERITLVGRSASFSGITERIETQTLLPVRTMDQMSTAIGLGWS